jgi:hypothetical protein
MNIINNFVPSSSFIIERPPVNTLEEATRQAVTITNKEKG